MDWCFEDGDALWTVDGTLCSQGRLVAGTLCSQGRFVDGILFGRTLIVRDALWMGGFVDGRFEDGDAL